MEFVFWVAFGLVSAGLFVCVSRWLGQERLVLGGGLVLLGGWYLLFGLSAGYGFEALLPQILGGLFFALCGVAGLAHSLVFLSVGWALHAIWDFASPLFSDVSYMPHWTAPACLGFDLLIGGYVWTRWRDGLGVSRAAL